MKNELIYQTQATDAIRIYILMQLKQAIKVSPTP